MTANPNTPCATPVVWITGASGGLGHRVAAHFAQTGARVALLAQHEATLQHTVATWPAEWQTRALCLPVNLLEPQAVQQAGAQVLQRWGRIDVAVHLAGGFTMGQGVHQPGFAAALDQMLDLNLRSVVHSPTAVVPAMLAQGGGAVVNVGAASAGQGAAHMGAYAASKSALARLTESLADAIGFLASPAARAVHGACLPVVGLV